jgi:adenylate cyclase
MPDANVTQRVAAILAADAVGYTRLMADDEAATIRDLDKAREIFVDHVETNQGRIVDTAGDSVLAVFETAAGSVLAGAAIQQGLSELNAELPEKRHMRFRLGIHLGDIYEKSDGTVYGDGINIAARLESIAEPGGVAVSNLIWDAVQGRLPFEFQSLGEQRVKNVDRPIRAWRLGTEAPHVGETDSASDTTDNGEMPRGPVIAVLPFANMSADPDQEFFADGLTEDIITGLSRFNDIGVIARNSTFRYKGLAVDIREVGEELGARYVLEGSVRKAGSRIRVTAQLIDSLDQTHIWADKFDRDLNTDDLFALQDELNERVMGAIADGWGAISRARAKATRSRPTHDLEAYECVLRGYEYFVLMTPESHALARESLEHAVKRDPNYTDAWAFLCTVYADDAFNAFNTVDDAARRAIEAGERAIALDSSHAWAHASVAWAHYCAGEIEPACREADIAIRLNPNNAILIGTMGFIFAFTPDWQRGLALIEKAIRLNPMHPVYFHAALFACYLRAGELDAAVEQIQAAKNTMKWWRGGVVLETAIFGLRGDRAKAERAAEAMRQTFSNLPKSTGRFLKGFIHDPALEDLLVDGLRKAGIESSDLPA